MPVCYNGGMTTRKRVKMVRRWVQLSPELLKKLETIARNDDRALAYVIRKVLTQYVDQNHG
jgi:predicted transcriptional regulator